ncbi:MAG: GNAT family N-acetyltransferase [Candidatus Uhrbacteria bacterium]
MKSLSTGFNIQQTSEPVSDSVWSELSAAMRHEKHILGSRIEPENLRKVFEQGPALLLTYEGETVGFFAAWPVAAGFFEFGSLWVNPKWRGQGLGDLVCELTAKLPGLVGHVGFAVTQNPLTISALRHAGVKRLDHTQFNQYLHKPSQPETGRTSHL